MKNMRRTGCTELPLHGGKAPRWLFEKMTELAREILKTMAYEHGAGEILRRLADPFWFQSLGCLLGFDWHSSGLTTTTCGALKEALKGLDKEIGLFAAGGKGKVALSTPTEIERRCHRFGIDAGEELIRVSRLTSKIDNSAIQDGFSLYHHSIFFTKDGHWCVIQQGLDGSRALARRYHWLSHGLKSFTSDPHSAVCCDVARPSLNLVAREAEENRSAMVELAKEGRAAIAEVELVLRMPPRHHINTSDIDPKRVKSVLEKTYQRLNSFEDLLLTRGAGPKFLRALALTAEVIYGKPASFRDPVRFSFAHGGKDGHPYPVNIRIYKHTIEALRETLNRAKIGHTDRIKAFRRLAKLEENL